MLELWQTLRHRKGTLKVPAIQEGGNGIEPSTQKEEPLPSSPPLCREVKKTSVALECSPLVVEWEAGNLQNFIHFLWLLGEGEEEVFLSKEVETFPGLDGWESKHLDDCFLLAGWENWSFLEGL